MLFLMLVVLANVVLAQNASVKQNKELRPPAQEKFEKDEQLIMSNRVIICLREDKEVNPPICLEGLSTEMRNEIWNTLDSVILYNRDATIWYNFSIDSFSPNHFLKNRKEGFLPFSAHIGNEGITLRMVSESPNWYEVEVNEETQATKFIVKSDPSWVKITWNYLLARVRLLSFDEENQPQLYDKPNGSVIEETSEIKWRELSFRLKIEGEWAFVEGYKSSKKYQGWVRWRKGRKMLFASKFFNDKFGKQIFNE